MAWPFVVISGGLYLLFRFGKKLVAIPTHVTLASDSLTILNQQNGKESRIPFDQIALYRAANLNGNGELRLTLRDGSKQAVRANSRLYGEQDFDEMVRTFEAGMTKHHPLAGQDGGVIRETTFFEKSISMVLMVLLTAALAWLTWDIMTSDQPFKASVVIAYSTYSGFAASWYASREGRRR